MGSFTAAKADITADASPQTLINLYSDASNRAKINNIIVSSGATPDDLAANIEVLRTTAIGTGTSLTLAQHDPDGPAAGSLAGYGHSVEPTESGAPLLAYSLNMRASFSWLANPGSELIIPKTANAGISVIRRSNVGTAYVMDCTILFEE